MFGNCGQDNTFDFGSGVSSCDQSSVQGKEVIHAVRWVADKEQDAFNHAADHACGDSGGGTTPPPEDPTPPPPISVTLSGKVIDGYISGATVCLDLNSNKVCDTGEPSATTGAGGVYSFDATQAEIDASPIVVEVPVGAVDEDDPANPAPGGHIVLSR